MSPKRSAESTQLIKVADEQGRNLARMRLRRLGYRIVADCEHLLDELLRSEQRRGSEVLGQVSMAARELIALTAPGSLERLFDDTMHPAHRLIEIQRAILLATSQALARVPDDAGEELIRHGLRELHEMAFSMFGAAGGERDAAGWQGTAAEPRERTERSFHILVADDDPQIASFLQRTIEKMGHGVSVASDGRRALEIAQEGRVDLILTDIEMPELDGISLLRLLKSQPSTREVPVLVISSLNDTASVTQCIELGAEDHIEKPIDRHLLRSRIVASLERKTLRDEELDHMRRVQQIVTAAEAVEREAYVAGMLKPVMSREDGLGQLARVFDRVVTGLQSREKRLREQLALLQAEVKETRDSNPTVETRRESPFGTGETIGARYEILARLGEGGMGTVYRAMDNELGETVALKVVRRDLVRSDPTIVERLKSEIRLARRISHRNVVRSHDLGESNGTFFITMEEVSGVTVSDLLKRRGRLTVASTLAIGAQLCDALAVAHEESIIHRDIKPSNLLVQDDGVLKVMDFGIARSLAGDRTRHTQGGFLVGTPQYMAPEVLMGGQASPQSDLFAVGVVLYECLTGSLPHSAEYAMELLAQIFDGQVLRVSQVAPDVPQRLETLIHQQLRFDPSSRSASARALADRLREIEHAGEPHKA